VTSVAAILAVAGAVVILLFQGVGARVPNPVEDPPPGYVDPLQRPLETSVIPLWRGDPPPPWVFGQRFARNLVLVARPGWVGDLPASRQWLQFAPLVLIQAAAITVLFSSVSRSRRQESEAERGRGSVGPKPAPRSDLAL
jgi:hypothetical protein